MCIYNHILLKTKGRAAVVIPFTDFEVVNWAILCLSRVAIMNQRNQNLLIQVCPHNGRYMELSESILCNATNLLNHLRAWNPSMRMAKSLTPLWRIMSGWTIAMRRMKIFSSSLGGRSSVKRSLSTCKNSTKVVSGMLFSKALTNRQLRVVNIARLLQI